MDRVKRALRRACILPVWKTALIAPPCFMLLFWVMTHPTPPVLDHIAFQLSIYALVISVTAGMRVWAWVKDWMKRSRLINSPFGILLRQDADFRAWLGLCLSMAWNVTYALAKLTFGAFLKSEWLALMGV